MHQRRRWPGLLTLLIVTVCVLRWGGYWLVATDPLPGQVDGAVVLQGSVSAENARLAGAMQLLEQNRAGRVLLSIPKQSYWGEPVAPAATRYLQRTFGGELASRVDFCETSADVDSTADEARALRSCIQDHGWTALAIVTSNYHTRRAGMIWRSVERDNSRIHLWIYGVDDPDFQPRGWWRKRRYAKTWFFEATKLVSEWLFG